MGLFDTHYDPAPLKAWAKTAKIVTLPALMANSVENHGELPFLGRKLEGRYVYHTFRETLEQARRFGAALAALGIETNDRVALMSTNCPEWAITDIGIMQAAAINVPLYPTLSGPACEYILSDSGSRLAVVTDHQNAKKLTRLKCPDLEHIVCCCSTEELSGEAKIWSWDEFLDFGAEHLSDQEPELDQRIERLEATDVCSLVYTSGTTGQPKGAMLMHGNFISNSTSVVAGLPVKPGDVQLSFLPLSHVFERFVYYGVMGLGGTICYAESLDTLKDDIALARPHLLPAVPRLYEKISAGILARAQGWKGDLLRQALLLGKKNFEGKQRRGASAATKLAYAMGHKLALSKIHKALGGRLRILVSGGAPLRSDVAEFFLHAGFKLSEGYGLTETSPAISFNPLDRPKIGTVGTAVTDVEVRIASDGEIQARGPNVMLGYFNNPEATRAIIDEQGWLSTGDIGELDSEGYLTITDRKKEILVMSNGKNVAPQPVEQALKRDPVIEQAVLLGDNRKFITALIVPSFAELKDWLTARGLTGSPQEIVDEEPLQDYILARCQTALESFSAYERPKKVRLLAQELTQETGELTPKLSVKRRVVADKFSDLIESMYPRD